MDYWRGKLPTRGQLISWFLCLAGEGKATDLFSAFYQKLTMEKTIQPVQMSGFECWSVGDR
jgi:hypothetical protein